MLLCSKVRGSRKNLFLGFGIHIIIKHIQLYAETEQRKDIYRDGGARSVGAIARGRQRGQRPASAIRPGGETETERDEDVMSKHPPFHIKTQTFPNSHIKETQRHHIQQRSDSAEGEKVQTRGQHGLKEQAKP